MLPPDWLLQASRPLPHADCGAASCRPRRLMVRTRQSGQPPLLLACSLRSLSDSRNLTVQTRTRSVQGRQIHVARRPRMQQAAPSRRARTQRQSNSLGSEEPGSCMARIQPTTHQVALGSRSERQSLCAGERRTRTVCLRVFCATPR